MHNVYIHTYTYKTSLKQLNFGFELAQVKLFEDKPYINTNY